MNRKQEFSRPKELLTVHTPQLRRMVADNPEVLSFEGYQKLCQFAPLFVGFASHPVSNLSRFPQPLNFLAREGLRRIGGLSGISRIETIFDGYHMNTIFDCRFRFYKKNTAEPVAGWRVSMTRCGSTILDCSMDRQ